MRRLLPIHLMGLTFPSAWTMPLFTCPPQDWRHVVRFRDISKNEEK